MKTIAWGTVYQIALRNCSKELERKASMYVILVKREYTKIKHSFQIFFLKKVSASPEDFIMKDFSAFLDMKRCKNWAHKIIS